MLQQDMPGDYVLATGEAHTVRAFTERAFNHIGIKLEWRGTGVDETGHDAKTGKVLVSVDAALFRPKDVNYRLGDAAKARSRLGWAPRMYFDALVSEMVNAERGRLWQESANWDAYGKMTG